MSCFGAKGWDFRLHRNVQRFRGGLVFKAQRLCVSLNSRLESNEEEEEEEEKYMATFLLIINVSLSTPK